MSEKPGKLPDQSRAEVHSGKPSRRPYRTPRLQDYGCVSNLTQAFGNIGGVDAGIYT